MNEQKNRHAWLAEVLRDIDEYVRENQLWCMSFAVSQAYDAARTEIAASVDEPSNVVALARVRTH